ncbi:MAG: ANL family adenylate-forming protein [Aeromonas sp.]
MSWFIEHSHQLGKRNAIIDQFGCFTYQDLFAQIEAYQQQLAGRINSHSIVALIGDYNFYAIALFFALQQQRCTIVPIVATTAQELDQRLNVAACTVCIHLQQQDISLTVKPALPVHPLIEQLQSKEHAGLILFSSGSTGAPKAMIHDLDNLLNSYQGKKVKNLNLLVFLMFDHIGGLNTLFNTLAMGAQLILPHSRQPDAIAKLIEQHKIHVLPSSPTFLNMLLMASCPARFDLSSLKMITYGTEAMPASLLSKLKTCFPKTKLLQTFGTSETGISQTSSRNSSSLELRLDDPNTEYKIVAGELWLRSKTQILGYLNATMDSFTSDGWFKTGDLVEELADGYLKIQGRAKEVINVGGEKVLPAEVESVLFELPEIADCLVYGESNAITGQAVTAEVVLHPGTELATAKRLIRSHCRIHLARYKNPAKILFVAQTNISERFKKKRL